MALFIGFIVSLYFLKLKFNDIYRHDKTIELTEIRHFKENIYYAEFPTRFEQKFDSWFHYGLSFVADENSGSSLAFTKELIGDQIYSSYVRNEYVGSTNISRADFFSSSYDVVGSPVMWELSYYIVCALDPCQNPESNILIVFF